MITKSIENQLLNFLVLSFKKKLRNSSSKYLYLLLNVIPIKFELKESIVYDNVVYDTINGFFGGNVSYNYDTKQYEIIIIIYYNKNKSTKEKIVQKTIEKILTSSLNSFINENFLFVYLHELHHIFQKHLIHQKRYLNIATNMLNEKNKKVNKIKDNEILNIAFDYHINSLIYHTNLFTNLFKKNNKNFLFNKNLNSKKMNELEILKKIINDGKIEILNNDFLNLIKLNIDIDGDKNDILLNIDIKLPKKDIKDNIQTEMSNVVNQVVSSIKSAGGISILETLGLPTKVDISWFNLLEKSINIITEKYSNKIKRNWCKKNIFFPRYTLPGKIKIKDDKTVILLIDYSSSMSNYVLTKINYILIKLLNKNYKLEIIGHTTKIQLKKTITKKADLKEFIKTRTIKGGTSHKECFDYLENKIKDQSTIVILLSDMQSDIENIYKNYKFWNKIKSFFINTSISSLDNIKLQKMILEKNIKLFNI